MRPARAHLADVLVAVLAAGAVAMLAAFTLASVYGAEAFALPAAVGIVSGLGVAVLAERLRLSLGLTLAVAAAAYVAGALLTATSAVVTSPEAALVGLREVVTGPVLGWKGMVTLPTPLGTYQGVMVPAYALLFAGSCGAVSVALRARRWWWGAVIAAATFVAALALGPAVRGGAPALLGLTIPREAAVGLAAFAALLGWFIAVSALQRRRVRHAVGSATAAPLRRSVGGLVGGVVMAAAAIAGAVLVVGLLPTGVRDVARSSVEASTTVAMAETPLATYRLFQTDAAYDQMLFTVAGDGIDRVRLAVLPTFDGQGYGMTDADGATSVTLRRLPSGVGIAADATAVEATVTVASLTGIWTPLVGELDAITFPGPREASLEDTFYYVPGGGSGVIAVDGGLAEGDVIRMSAGMREPGTLVGATGQASPTVDEALLPESMLTWIADQEVGRDGGALLELIDRLRSRGYLSHALTAADTGAYAWQSALGDHAFVPSEAGGSTARIGELFDQLNTRAAEVGGTDDALLVAAVGDDEQFATAGALLASALGFDSRVVVGTRLAATDERGWTPPLCDSGECAGRNVSAWIEVRADAGWVPVDTSPQTETPLSPEVSPQTDPEYATDLREDTAEVVAPPTSQRSRSGEESVAEDTTDEASGPMPSAVRAALGSALLLLALILPFVVLLGWKSFRTARRRGGPAREAVQDGWEQYLDNAADAGLAHAAGRTRAEVARLYGSPNGAAIATLADRGTFAHTGVDADDAAFMWELIRDDRRHWASQLPWWKRPLMALSWRSLTRGIRQEPAGSDTAPTRRARTWRSDRSAMTRSATRSATRSGITRSRKGATASRTGGRRGRR